MNNDKGVKTSEFWAMIAATAVSLGVAFGLIRPEAQGDLSTTISNIVAAVAAIAPSIAYIMSRTWLKAKTTDELKKN
jgi:hypothetical protein